MGRRESANQNNVGEEAKSWSSSYPRRELKSGGNGGNNGGMDRIDLLEKRFDKLEGKFDGLHKDVVDLRVSVATLAERVAHLPSKGFIVASTVSALTFLTALMLFREKILSLFG